MIRISVRDSYADLPPSVLKKKLEERKAIEDAKKSQSLKTITDLWAWLQNNIGINVFNSSPLRSQYLIRNGFTCEIVDEQVFGQMDDIIFEPINKRIVIDIHRNSGPQYTYIITEQYLSLLTFKMKNNELIIKKNVNQ